VTGEARDEQPAQHPSMTSTSGKLPSGTVSGPPRSGDVDAELSRVRAERDAARAQLDKQDHRAARGGIIRRTIVGILVFLIALLVPITLTATWAHRTVLNTDAYVKTVTPIAQDPAVTAAVARIATDQLYAALDPQQAIAAALPPKAAFLAGPIANGVKGFVQDQATKVLSSSQFQQIWVTANRFAHTELLKVLNGDSKALVTTNGQVVLSLVPLLNQVLKRVQGTISAITGKNITLPQLSGNELPSAACAKVSAALGRPLPATCGQIPLFPASKLHQAQWAVRAFNRAVIALLIIVPLLIVATLWLARRRRRTLLQLTVGALLFMVIMRRSLFWLQGDLIKAGRRENTAARKVIVQDILHSYFTLTAWALAIGCAVVVIAAVTGPYRWAVVLRGWVRTGAVATARLTRVAAGHARDESTGRWVRAHIDLLSIAGAALALLLVLVLSVSFVWLLVILALLAAYEFWMYRLRAETRNSPPPPTSPPATKPPTTTPPPTQPPTTTPPTPTLSGAGPSS
jgi:hypothetical protein